MQLEIPPDSPKSVESAASHPSYVQVQNGVKGERKMQFALLVYESPEAFKARNGSETDPYLGAWRAYHKALVEAVSYIGGKTLGIPATRITLPAKGGKTREIGRPPATHKGTSLVTYFY